MRVGALPLQLVVNRLGQHQHRVPRHFAGDGNRLFANRIPTGALLLVSDQPMIPEGVKTEASDAKVSAEYVQNHIKVGIEALRLIRRHGKSVRHLRFDE